MAQGAAASPVPLSGPELKTLVAGATIEIDAPFGNKIPVQYGTDGHVTGQAGGLAYYLGAPTDKGRWWISGDQLCHKWSVWFSSELQCLRLRKDGRTIHWENRDGKTGTATIVVAAPVHVASAQDMAPPQPVAPKRLPPPAPIQEKPSPEPRAMPKPEPRVETKPAIVPTQSVAAAPKPPVPVPAPVPVKNRPTAFPSVSASAATRISPPEFVVVNVQANDVLNLRNAPSSEAEIVGSLLPGSRGIAIIGACQLEWCPVQHNSKRGWVHRYYITSERADLPISE